MFCNILNAISFQPIWSVFAILILSPVHLFPPSFNFQVLPKYQAICNCSGIFDQFWVKGHSELKNCFCTEWDLFEPFLILYHAPAAPASIPSPLLTSTPNLLSTLQTLLQSLKTLIFDKPTFPNLTTHVFQSLQRPNIGKLENQNEVFYIFKPFFWLGLGNGVLCS